MKTKNTFNILLLLAAVTMPFIQGCKKYPEGPGMSLRSREERVANTWKVDNYKVNGTDYTSLTTDYTETYSKEGSYSFSWGSLNGTGTWAFQNSDEQIRITGSERTIYILKLEEKQFWYYYMDGSDRKEFHLVQK